MLFSLNKTSQKYKPYTHANSNLNLAKPLKTTSGTATTRSVQFFEKFLRFVEVPLQCIIKSNALNWDALTLHHLKLFKKVQIPVLYLDY